MNERCTDCDLPKLAANRRDFLAASTAVVSTVLLKSLFSGRVFADDANKEATLVEYPRVRIGSVSKLEVDKPVAFEYPKDVLHNGAMLVKLGRKAGGGVGDGQDIVAFNTRCTHMGGDVSGSYSPEYKVAGPCPEHLTTFDLTRHGMVVSGHAPQSLTQVVLEVDGDDIVAVGMIGLMYGHHAQPVKNDQ